MKKRAIVLEGGSLRCMFTAGALDIFMEEGMEADGLFGVSAGALTGVNVVSRQPGRTAKINLDYVNDKRYLGLRNLLLHKSIFNFDFLFGERHQQMLLRYAPVEKRSYLVHIGHLQESEVAHLGVRGFGSGHGAVFGVVVHEHAQLVANIGIFGHVSCGQQHFSAFFIAEINAEVNPTRYFKCIVFACLHKRVFNNKC